MIINTDDLEKGYFYGVGRDGVFYKVELPIKTLDNAKTLTIVMPRCPHCGGKIERRGNEFYCLSCHFWWEADNVSSG